LLNGAHRQDLTGPTVHGDLQGFHVCHFYPPVICKMPVG